jgi:4-diphosphocytidyl-2C-methyl-D-erythritol kinase
MTVVALHPSWYHEQDATKKEATTMNSGQLGLFYAYGKINWSLLITGIREDGYHLLDTVMQRIDLCDEITLIPAANWSIACSSSQTPNNGDNTAMLAAKAYAQATGIADAYHISIRKNIPVGAGLGGGSADAAAVLSALNGKYGALTQKELLLLALSIGADVPFCLVGGCARCTGVGEVMEPAKSAKTYHLVIAGCGANLSTARVFQRYDAILAAEAANGKSDDPRPFEEARASKEAFPREREEAPFAAFDGAAPTRPFVLPESQAGQTPCFPARTGEELTAELLGALSTGCARSVARALQVFACRLRGNGPSPAEIGGIPCDERYAAEAGCTLCVATAQEVLCGANDLTCAACDLAPGVADTLLRLRRSGALAVSMSGSGSACFGLFADKESAQEAAKQLCDLPLCVVCSTKKAD